MLKQVGKNVMSNATCSQSFNVSPHKVAVHCCCSCLVTKSCLILCDLVNYSPPGSSVQARILEWAAISSFRESQPKGQTWVSWIGRWIPYHWATRKAHSFSMNRKSNFSVGKSRWCKCFLTSSYWLDSYQYVFHYVNLIDWRPINMLSERKTTPLCKVVST